MQIFKVCVYTHPCGVSKEYSYYFSCFRKASAYVDSQKEHFIVCDEHGAIFRMEPDSFGQFKAVECVKTW